MLMVGMASTLLATFIPTFYRPFLGSPLLFMLVYVWSRNYPGGELPDTSQFCTGRACSRQVQLRPSDVLWCQNRVRTACTACCMQHMARVQSLTLLLVLQATSPLWACSQFR